MAGIGLHGVAHVVRGSEFLSGDAGQVGDGLFAVVGMGIDAGAYGGASQAEFAEDFGGGADGCAALADGAGVGGELLAQAHGDRVLHVGAAGLQDVVKFFRLCLRLAARSSRTG